MNQIIGKLTALFTDGFGMSNLLRLTLTVVITTLILAVLGRVFFGRRSGLNHCVCSAIGILFVYAITILIYAFQPVNLSRFLAPLPFVSFHGEYLLLFSFGGSEFPALCLQLVNMIILAFLANLIDNWMPAGKKIYTWYLLRFASVLLALIAQLIVTSLLTTYLPGVLVSYAPIILVGILVLMILMTFLKVILGLILTAVNPILGAVYAFFFSSIVGKMLGRAIVTTILLSTVVWLLERMDATIVSISPGMLTAYGPLILVLLILWYLLGLFL